MTKRVYKYSKRKVQARTAAYTKAGPVIITRGDKSWTESAYGIHELAIARAGGRPRTQRKISPKQRRFIYLRDGGRCRYCGKVCDDAHRWEIDHVRPVALGGDDNSSNLVLSCRRCNRDKKTEQWVPRPNGRKP